MTSGFTRKLVWNLSCASRHSFLSCSSSVLFSHSLHLCFRPSTSFRALHSSMVRRLSRCREPEYPSHATRVSNSRPFILRPRSRFCHYCFLSTAPALSIYHALPTRFRWLPQSPDNSNSRTRLSAVDPICSNARLLVRVLYVRTPYALIQIAEQVCSPVLLENTADRCSLGHIPRLCLICSSCKYIDLSLSMKGRCSLSCILESSQSLPLCISSSLSLWLLTLHFFNCPCWVSLAMPLPLPLTLVLSLPMLPSRQAAPALPWSALPTV
jgi:hypothetical protein